MDEFISFVRTKETEPKKNRPDVLACGCSAHFSLNRARVNSGYALRQAPRYSGSDFQCSTTQKGIEVKIKRKDQTPPVGAPPRRDSLSPVYRQPKKRL